MWSLSLVHLTSLINGMRLLKHSRSCHYLNRQHPNLNVWWVIMASVRLNLFNHVLALFRANFACNSAIRYFVFRWELCKDCVWEIVKNLSVCAIKSILTIGTREWLATDDSPKCHMCEACRKLKGRDSWSTTGQKGQSGQLVISRLKLATCPSREWVARTFCFVEKWLFIFLTYPIINTLTPRKFRKLLERILRDKP